MNTEMGNNTLEELLELNFEEIEISDDELYEWYDGCWGLYLIDSLGDNYGEFISELGRDKKMSIDDLLESKRNFLNIVYLLK